MTEHGGEVRNEVSGHVGGPVVQAGQIDSVVFHTPSGPPVEIPRQLPPPPRGFVNRAVELAALDDLLEVDGGAGAPLTVVVSGLGGVGKSAISRRWAHRVSDRFTDGQLYADLEGYRHGGGVEVGDVLGGFLRSLGVREEWIPAGLAERAALFRSRTAGLRLLVLVDDAHHAAEVVPLLPPSATSAVVVTSQRRLGGLVVDGARSILLTPLTLDESLHLLANLVGADRMAAEPAAAEELARLCAGLPIALRVAGARLIQRPSRLVSKLVAELTDGRRRLERLSTEGDLSVEAVFETAYRGLPSGPARLYRLLGLLPLATFSAGLAQAVLAREAEPYLETLLEAHLVEEPLPDRFRLHDLVRLHAARCAEREEPAADQEAALRAAAAWYLGAVCAADRAIMGDRVRLAPEPAAPAEPFDSSGEALDWLEAERGNLLALLRLAAGAGWHEFVWQCAEALWALYHQRKHYADWQETSRLGAESARALGYHAAEARMRNQLARAYIELADFPTAGRELDAAARAADAAGEPLLRAIVLESFGQAELAQNRPEAAAERFTRALAIHEAIGRRRGIGMQSYHLGLAHTRAGHAEEAVAAFQRAMSIMEERDDELSQGKIAIERAVALRHLGRGADAAASARQGLAIMRERRVAAKQIRALRILADLASDDGDREQERRCLEQALSVALASGNQAEADLLRERMP
jgi:tetratricopeptide (TPR) repeat protein